MSETRESDGRRFAASLAATTTAMDNAEESAANAEHSWGLWADSVRQDAEQRQGVEYGQPGDQAVLDDPEYSHALDLGSAISEIKGELSALADRWCQIDLREAEPEREAG